MNTQKILEKLIRFKTITPKEEGIYDYILSLFDDFSHIRIDKEDVRNIFIYKRFGDGLHVNFCGHVDVVPAGGKWQSDPFEPVIKDGMIYGRGTQDMKGPLACFLSAICDVKEFNGTISILLTSDEEGDGIYGIRHALDVLEHSSMLPDLAIVAEPTCEAKLGDTIKVGRRGSINGKLTIHGKSGHAAYVQKCVNPISKNFGQFLQMVSHKNLDDGDEFFAPSVIVPTTLKSGYGVTNLTPADLELLFNVRNSTHSDKNTLESFIKKALSDYDITDYELDIRESSQSFLTDLNTDKAKILLECLMRAIEDVVGVVSEKTTGGGTSDARFFAKKHISVVEFGLVNDTIHSVDERTSLEDLQKLQEIFALFLSLISQKAVKG